MNLLAELKRRNVIRVGIAYVLMAWVLLQGADFVLDLVGAPEWVVRALAVIAIVGLVVALVFAWAFEMTPEGLKRDHEVDRSRSITSQTGRKLDRTIIVFLGLVVGWFLLDEFYLEPRAQTGGTAAEAGADPAGAERSAAVGPGEAATVAVLPFRAMSSGADDEYFADGLTEEILNSLAQVPGLSVTSRTSSFYFKDKDLPIADIADQLGVAHVVEGSVRRSGDRLRVTAQLIRTADDTHLWSNNYDRADADAIAVQEDIAQRIAETLNVFLDENTLARMRRAGIRDVDAFIEYARGLEMHGQAHGSDHQLAELAEANKHLAAAVEAAPGFTPAWLVYSDYYTHLLIDSAIGDLTPRPGPDELEAAYDETQRAFQQAARHASDPGARTAAELELAIIRGDTAAWRPLLEATFDTDSCFEIIWIQLLGYLPGYSDRFKSLLERLVQCDPMAPDNRVELAQILIAEGQPALALEKLNETTVSVNEFTMMFRIIALLALGEFEAAESVAAIDLASEGSRLTSRMMIAAARGDAETVLALSEDMAERRLANDYRTLLWSAWIGDRDTANAMAGRIDTQPMGHLALLIAMMWCQCGAPFDLDAAPRFANMWRRADFPWPIPAPIDFPLKDW